MVLRRSRCTRVSIFRCLTLQKNPDIDPSSRLMLGSASVLIGFAQSDFAIPPGVAVGHHHAPRTEIAASG